jgi:hypothetical protein
MDEFFIKYPLFYAHQNIKKTPSVCHATLMKYLPHILREAFF